MPADDPSGARPAQPVVLRIKLRYDDIDAMVQRFAPNVGRSGLFLPTRSLQPIGTEVKFELRLANDQPVLVGLGRVKSARAPDPANPRAAFGIAIELMRVTREGREVIIRMIERRRALGLADVAIPMPEDVETAKRADLDSQPRADAGAIVRDGLAGSIDSAPILSTPPPKRSPAGPIGEAKRASEPLMTAPRVTPVAMAAARPIADRSAPVLAPEPARAKRPRVADLIAKAGELSGSAFTSEKVPELDDQVDIGKALARARALAGANDLDEELAALREVAAAPLAEISIEAASAELARQLGGVAIGRRVKGAVRVETAVVTALGTAEVTTVPPPEPEPVRERPGTSSEEMDRLAAEAAAGIAATHGPGAVAVERADEPPPVIEPVSEPIPEPVVEAVVAPPPPVTVEEDNELGSFGRALDAARIHTGVSTQAAPAPATDDDEIAELDADDIEELPGESTQIGQHPAADADDVASSIQQAAAVYEAELAQVPEAHPSSADDFNEEEISDLDVLAEADADDDDLLAANAERESQDGAPAYAPQEHYAHEHPAVYGEATPDAFGEQTYAAAPEPDLYAQTIDPYAAQAVAAHEPHDSFAANEPDPYTAEDPIGYADPDAEPVPIATPAAARAAYGRAQSYDSYPPTPYGGAAREPYVPDPYAQEAYGQQAYDAQRAHDPAYAAEDAYANELARQAAKPASTDEDFDFASHLDLGDESGVQHPPAPDPNGYDIPSEYTFAEQLPTRAPSYAEGQIFPEPPGLDEALEFDEPHQFATQTPAPPTPRPASRGAGAYSRQRSPSKPQRAQPANFEAREDSVDFDEPHGFVDRSGRGNYPDDHGGRDGRDISGYSAPLDPSRLDAELTPPPAGEPADDLESALSTLDVDLDHLEVPLQHRSRRPRAERSSDRGSRPLPGMPPERSPSEPPAASPVARPVPRPTAHTTPRPAAKRPSAAPPAVPVAAKRPTALPPRATSEDDGVIIDFDDDDE